MATLYRIESKPTMGGWIVRFLLKSDGSVLRQFTGIKAMTRPEAERKALLKIAEGQL